MPEVNPYYLAAFTLYLLVVLAIGLWAYTRTKDVMDFWVFGQEMGPVLATTSLVANFVSSVSVIGFIGAVYAEGYAIMTHTILGLMLGLSALYFVVGYVRPLNVLTFPDLVARVTGYQISRPLAGTILLLSGWLYLIMQLVGAGLLITAITGVPYPYMVWVVGAVFIVYTVLGGLVSVAWTDLLQGVLMVMAVLVALGFMIGDLGGLASINERLAGLGPARVSPTAGGTYTVLGIAGTFLAFFGTILTEQDMLIRIAATRDVRTAKIHVAAAGVVLSVFYCALIMLGGATTVALLGAGSGVENPDAAFPALITGYVPTGVGVVIILAVMSAILSTTDTRLHATGMTVARDIYSYFRPRAGGRRLLRVSRVATVVLGLTATAAAVDPPGTIIVMYGFRAVLLTTAFLIPVYAAVFWTDLEGGAVVTAIAGGGLVGLGTHVAGGGGIGSVPSTFLGMAAATTLLLIGHFVLRGGGPRASGFGRAPAIALLALGAISGVATPTLAQHPGPSNTITDVPGIRVGHETRIGEGYRTGTTVVLTPEGATAGVSVMGGAPGTRETDLLAPGGLVTRVHAVVLSGGSAYGLATATGVMRWLEERGHGFPVRGGVVPIVPAAILFDLGRGGDFSRRPDAGFGYRAADAATADPVERGRVGAGTGARYGLGSASVVLPGGYTVGAVVALNPAGSPVDPRTCLPYGSFLELDGEFGLVAPDPEECAGVGAGDAGPPPGEAFNTTIAVVATNAPLDQVQAERMARVANSGLARSIRPVHGLFDGDAVFGLSTTTPSPAGPGPAELQAVYSAAADVLGRAVVHALLAGGVYCERHPGACRDR